MQGAARKLNFMIEDEIREELEQWVPAGKRSAFVNQALRKELEAVRRQNAVARLKVQIKEGQRFSTQAILAQLANDRKDR